MKTMLIAAAAVGAAIAGLILYSDKKRKSGNSITGAAKDAYQTMNRAIGSVERPAHHAMG